MGIQHLSKVQEPKGTDSVVSQCVTRITKKFKLPVDYSWLRCYRQPCPESPSVSSKPCITLDIGLSRFCCIEPGSPPRETEVAQHVLSGIPKIVLGNLTISGSTILLHLQLTPQRCAPVDTPIQVGGRGRQEQPQRPGLRPSKYPERGSQFWPILLISFAHEEPAWPGVRSQVSNTRCLCFTGSCQSCVPHLTPP